MMWIYIWLSLMVSRSVTQGSTNSNTSEISPTQPLKFYVNREAVYNLGSNADLSCSKRMWNETMYVIWKIELKNKNCRISYSNEGESSDSCKDGKSLQNTSTGQSYLHIPNFSGNDVGVYKCESVYTGGSVNYKIAVAVTAAPTVSAWLERRENKMVAFCRAEKGNPAANISWSFPGNDSVTQQNDPDGFVTVESQLELPGDIITDNLSCIVQHQLWDQERTFVPKLNEAPLFWSIIVVFGVVFVLLVGLFVLALKKVIFLRQCQPADLPSKSNATEDVEEVEPYASYVQRVNSIYN